MQRDQRIKPIKIAIDESGFAKRSADDDDAGQRIKIERDIRNDFQSALVGSKPLPVLDKNIGDDKIDGSGF